MYRKIPTFVGIFLTFCIIGVIIFFIEYALRSPSSASESLAPRNIQVTNVSESSLTVAWTTQSATTGYVILSGANQKNLTVYDDRNVKDNLHTYTVHSATARNLKPNSSLNIKIYSNGKSFDNPNSSKKASTGPQLLVSNSTLEPAYGVITSSLNEPIVGALVTLQIEGGQILSTLTNANGSWLIPLNNVRTELFQSYIPVSERMNETITAMFGEEKAIAVTDSLNDQPVPAISLGKEYDFRKIQTKTPTNIAKSKEKAVLGVNDAKKSYSASLIQPAEGAALSTFVPLIQGTGIPGKNVSVVIGITHLIFGTTTVNKDGTWRFTPPKSLGIGKQSVTITTNDQNNKPIALTHQFTILKSGTQVLGDATPSALLTPILDPDLLTPAPTSTLAGDPVPISGTLSYTYALLLIGVTFLIGGAFLLAR